MRIYSPFVQKKKTRMKKFYLIFLNFYTTNYTCIYCNSNIKKKKYTKYIKITFKKEKRAFFISAKLFINDRQDRNVVSSTYYIYLWNHKFSLRKGRPSPSAPLNQAFTCEICRDTLHSSFRSAHKGSWRISERSVSIQRDGLIFSGARERLARLLHERCNYFDARITTERIQRLSLSLLL